MDKNTQQPVAWIDDDGMVFWKDGIPPDGTDLFAAPPVPRDVLMAFGVEVADKSHAAGVIGNLFTDEDIAAIADRYASQVQTERKSITPQKLADHLAAGGYAKLDNRATKPEPVNQQLLAALKLGKNSLLAFKLIPGQSNAWEEHDEANLVAINAAIAAAEAAQKPEGGE